MRAVAGTDAATPVPRSSDAGRPAAADTNSASTGSGLATAVLTPELVLVDPELAKTQRQTTNGKAAMSSTEPANEMFSVDQAQPEADPQISPSTPPAPAEAPAVAAAPEPAPEPPPAPAPPPAAVEPTTLPATSMVDVPLGTLIFRAGLLAEEQLEEALQEVMRTGKRLGEVLLERGWIAEKDLGRMLAGQKGLPFIEVTASDARPDALRALPEENARLQVALPLRYEDHELVVAVADPSNELAIENVRRALGFQPNLVVAPHGELLQAIDEAYAALNAPQPQVAEAPEPAPAPEPPAVESAPAAPPASPTSEVEAPASETQPEPEPEAQPEVVQWLNPPALPPTVLPAAEDRSPEPAVDATPDAPVAEVAPQPAQPVTPESTPVAETTAPAVVEEPLAQPEDPTPVAPEEPAQAEAPAPVAEEPATEEPAQPTPPEQPAEAPSAPEAQLDPPAEEATSQNVVLRLEDGETLEVGAFASAAEATAYAQEVVSQIASTDEEVTWPFFANRFLRPDTILSVDLIEAASE